MFKVSFKIYIYIFVIDIDGCRDCDRLIRAV